MSGKTKKEKFKNMIKENAKTITLAALEYILETMENLVELSLEKKAAFHHLHNFSQDSWSKPEISRFIDSLRRRGYIEINKENKNQSIQFTNKTRLALLDQLSSKAEADCKNRFISFDIPEPMRNKRNAFRRLIKQLGFRQVQRSLWVCNKNVDQLVELAAYDCGVEKYVVFIISEKSDIDGIIEKILASIK